MAAKQQKVKICLWTHVQNEAPIIRRMLESAADYIDYWVIVDNGSADGTQDIIRDFFAEKGIPGNLYQSKIGWVGHGINRQHSWEFLTKEDHGCKYILRIDADETIVVDEDFDWSLISNRDAYQIIYSQGDFCVPRMWLWREDLGWHWAPDAAHETIHLKGGREPDVETLPFAFRHVGFGGGNSYSDPIKYIKDILNLETQIHERLRDGSTAAQEKYHLLYLCKSFNYTGMGVDSDWAYKFFAYGKTELTEFLRRGVFYYENYLKRFKDGKFSWSVYYGLAELYLRLGEEYKYLMTLRRAHAANPVRSEPVADLFYHYLQSGNKKESRKWADMLRGSTFRIEDDPYEVLRSKYYQWNKDLRTDVDERLKMGFNLDKTELRIKDGKVKI